MEEKKQKKEKQQLLAMEVIFKILFRSEFIVKFFMRLLKGKKLYSGQLFITALDKTSVAVNMSFQLLYVHVPIIKK